MNGQPWWRLGYRIATGALPTLLTGLAAGPRAGRAGPPRGCPARRFLLCLLLTGLLIICAGYVSSLGNPLAAPVDQLINGAASAFRNLRKFDPLIRLPIALGLAHLLGAAVRLPGSGCVGRPARRSAAAAAVAIGGLALPAYQSGLADAGLVPADPVLLGERGELAEPARGPPGRARRPRRGVRPVPVGQPAG